MANKTVSFVPFIEADQQLVLTLDFNLPFEDQVKEFFEQCPDLSTSSITGYFGQGTAAILALPVLEMSSGLPKEIAVMDMGSKKVVGNIDLNNFRHQVARPQRQKLGNGVKSEDYIVLDGAGRGLTPVQLEELEAELQGKVTVVSIPIGHIDFTNPTAGILETIIDTGISFEQLTGGKVFYLPPGLGLAAAIQSTALYGLSEVWLPVIRLNRKEDNQFHVEEVCYPQTLRQFGVQLSKKWRDGNAPVMVSRGLAQRLLNPADEEARELLAELLK